MAKNIPVTIEVKNVICEINIEFLADVQIGKKKKSFLQNIGTINLAKGPVEEITKLAKKLAK